MNTTVYNPRRAGERHSISDSGGRRCERLPEVLAAQGDTIRVLHTLRPLIVVMAGENEFDPCKD